MIDLGLRQGHILAVTVLMGLVAGLSAYLLSKDLTTAAVTFAASGACAGLIAGLILRFLRMRISTPLRGALKALDEKERDLLTPEMEENAAPILRTLFMRIAESRASSIERQRLSEAKIVSVEAAFDRIHAVLQSLTEGIIVVDEEAKIVLSNHSARNVLAESKKGLEGKPLIDVLTPELKAAARNGLTEVSGKDDLVYQQSQIEAQGRVYDLSVVPMRMHRMGQDCGRVLLISDVTKSFEISRLKDELLSSISHELRTPLTNICSSVELISQLGFDDRNELQEFCGVAKNEAMHLNGLVDAVIYYSQIETGEIEWSFEYFDMTDLVDNACKALESKAEAADLTLEIIGNDSGLATRADHARTQDVILRLVDNAIKFTPGGGRIQLQTQASDDMIHVSVADSGDGVPEEFRDRVFDRFAQLGDIMTEKPVGTGLGLAICHRVIEAMGGRIWCEDSRFGGACFHFELPAAKAREESLQAT